MKTIISIIIAVLLGYIGLDIYTSKNNVNNKTFNEYRQEFRAEIDTIKLNLDEIKANTDTLKKGQMIIYKQFKEKSNNKFLDNLQMLF